MKTLDAKTLSEIALALCLAGAVVVWIGLRVDRYVVRWIGMAVIVAGLVGLIFQGSLTHQTLASQPSFSFPAAPTATSPSPSISTPPSSPPASPSPKKKKPAKPKKKPPASTGGSSGGYTPPAPPAPQPNPPGGGGGGTPPFQGSPVP